MAFLWLLPCLAFLGAAHSKCHPASFDCQQGLEGPELGKGLSATGSSREDVGDGGPSPVATPAAGETLLMAHMDAANAMLCSTALGAPPVHPSPHGGSTALALALGDAPR